MKKLGSQKNINSLQVILSRKDNNINYLRCLPGFINKKQLNKHYFESPHRGDKHFEIFLGNETYKLQNQSTKQQLYGLLSAYGIDHTFNYLQSIVDNSAATVHLYKGNFEHNTTINKQVENSIHEMLHSIQDTNKESKRIQDIISGMTIKLLNNSPRTHF